MSIYPTAWLRRPPGRKRHVWILRRREHWMREGVPLISFCKVLIAYLEDLEADDGRPYEGCKRCLAMTTNRLDQKVSG